MALAKTAARELMPFGVSLSTWWRRLWWVSSMTFESEICKNIAFNHLSATGVSRLHGKGQRGGDGKARAGGAGSAGGAVLTASGGAGGTSKLAALAVALALALALALAVVVAMPCCGCSHCCMTVGCISVSVCLSLSLYLSCLYPCWPRHLKRPRRLL